MGCSPILSPSRKSIARLALPSRPALKSLSGSGRLAPWEKVSFTLFLWALATAIIPSRDHAGLPIHFHSSIISRSASRMLFRMLANVLPRQSVSSAISWSIRSDGFIGLSCGLKLFEPIIPKWFGMNGGDDETRTRDLCRDRQRCKCNRLISNGVGGHLLIPQGTRCHFLSSPYCTQIGLVPCLVTVGLPDVSCVRHPALACSP